MLNEYSAAMEARTSSVSAPYYADDITSKFANAPVVTGRDGVLAQMADVLTRVRLLGTSVNVWEEDGGVVDFEVDSIWNLLDG